VPSELSDWNFEVIEEICATGRVETDRYDFKRMLPNGEALTKLCCAFANSLGGFIIVGVREESGSFKPFGIAPDLNIATTFGQKFRADPSILYEPPKAIEVPGSDNVIYVFHILRSDSRPHLPADRDKRFFWKRTSSGCEQMSLEEVRSLFIDYEGRRRLIALLYWHINSFRITADLATSLSNGKTPPPGPDIEGIERIIPEVWPLLHDEHDIVDRLMSVRHWAKSMAADAAHIRMQCTNTLGIVRTQAINSYVKLAADKGRRGTELADHLLAALDEKFGTEASLHYRPSPQVVALMRDSEYP
jgi:hypothetical protein